MVVLKAKTMRVPDLPPEIFAFGHHDHNELARIFVPFIETLMPDEVAWDAVFSSPESPYYAPLRNIRLASSRHRRWVAEQGQMVL